MKISERDKILLIVLGVILVIAIVLILPGVGIMDCRKKTAEYESQTKDVEAKLNTLRQELAANGVSPNNYESPSNATASLEHEILALKDEASRLDGNILPKVANGEVEEEWIKGLEYRYGVKGDDSEKIVDFQYNSEDMSANYATKQFEIAETGQLFEMTYADRKIEFSTTNGSNSDGVDCEYVATYAMNAEDISDLGCVLLFLQHMMSKGSILINDLKYSTGSGKQEVNFTVLMTKDGEIAKYAQQVEEAKENGEYED